ncbi:MAG: TauD/TfdA family dioxygenase [Actinomycetota bacterium]
MTVHPAAMDAVSTIDRIEPTEDELHVWFTGADRPLALPWFWIRDHSRDPSAYDPHTGQRAVDSFAIDHGLRPAAVDRTDGAIRVRWPDDTPPSVLPDDLVAALHPAASDPLAPPPIATPWHSADEVSVTRVPYAEIADGAGVDALLDDLARFGFGLVSGARADEAGTTALADAIGYVRRSIYGDVWPLSSELTDHADTAYGQSYLEPHTDGTYCHDGPGLQLFVCAERTGTGGESILVDGFAVAETLRRTDPEAYELLTTVSVPAHYREPGVDLRASRPTIRLEGDAVVQVSFNNYDRSPFVLAPDRLRAWYRAYGAFHRLITDRTTWWLGRLEPGDALIFDNWRCLHGRMGYTGRRRFYGCYLNHEDLESRLRVRSAATP